MTLTCPRFARFISTCVEQTYAPGGNGLGQAVHLHVRGADSGITAPVASSIGSSPRAWSRPRILIRYQSLQRFISTCVEQTIWERIKGVVETVHLHVRGADIDTDANTPDDIGSSPRAWSRPWWNEQPGNAARFISTCVEQTWGKSFMATSYAVHLHVRGADPSTSSGTLTGYGSSPRAWSRPDETRQRFAAFRFISTCVEQTAPTADDARAVAVHLHVRGADGQEWGCSVRLCGSSPRAWSRQTKLWTWEVRDRFISTCVEQTPLRRTPAAPASVHLHVRGADCFGPRRPPAGFGSSPRAWSRRSR